MDDKETHPDETVPRPSSDQQSEDVETGIAGEAEEEVLSIDDEDELDVDEDDDEDDVKRDALMFRQQRGVFSGGTTAGDESIIGRSGEDLRTTEQRQVDAEESGDVAMQTMSSEAGDGSSKKKKALACEPCRLAKKRCAGNRQTCERCIKFGIEHLCKYLEPKPRSSNLKYAKVACIGCRNAKAACTDTRPCARCARLEIPCEDVHPSSDSKDSPKISHLKPTVLKDIIINKDHPFCQQLYEVTRSLNAKPLAALCSKSSIRLSLFFSVFVNALPRVMIRRILESLENKCMSVCEKPHEASLISRKFEALKISFKQFLEYTPEMHDFVLDSQISPDSASSLAVSECFSLPSPFFTQGNDMRPAIVVLHRRLPTILVSPAVHVNVQAERLYGYTSRELIHLRKTERMEKSVELDPSERKMGFMYRIIFWEDWNKVTRMLIKFYILGREQRDIVRIVTKNGAIIDCHCSVNEIYHADGSFSTILYAVPAGPPQGSSTLQRFG